MWRGGGEKNRHWKVKGTIADGIPLVCTQAPPHLQVADEGYGVYVYGWSNEHEEDSMGILTMY